LHEARIAGDSTARSFLVPGARHAESLAADPAEYGATLAAFLEKRSLG
jgi:hypothetical protein